MNCIARVIDWTVSCIKTVRGVVEVLVEIGRIFSGIYLFNKVLGG